MMRPSQTRLTGCARWCDAERGVSGIGRTRGRDSEGGRV